MSKRACFGALVVVVLAGCNSSSSTGVDAGPGSGGSGGSGGSATDAAILSPCGVVELEPNDTRDSATLYTAGTEVVACLASADDVDYYQVTAPATDLAGGYYLASLTNVGASDIKADVYSAKDNSLIVTFAYNGDQGGSLYFYWAAAPGEVYRIAVSKFSVLNQAAKYTFKAAYTKVNDTYEPNDTRETATPLTLGTPLMGYFFTGFRHKDIAPEEYQDWYSVTLAAGTATIKVDNVATNLDPQVELYDPSNALVTFPVDGYNASMGGSLNVQPIAITTPGAYHVVVSVFSVLPEAGKLGMTAPDNFTRPYTLTVSQP